MEGWLSVPNKQNFKKYGWRKQYVVVSSKKVLFYSSEVDKSKSMPVLILDIEWVHVLFVDLSNGKGYQFRDKILLNTSVYSTHLFTKITCMLKYVF